MYVLRVQFFFYRLNTSLDLSCSEKKNITHTTIGNRYTVSDGRENNYTTIINCS